MKKIIYSLTIIMTFVLTFGSGVLSAQTYTTIANGNWNSASTWLNGIIPPSMNTLPIGGIVNIRHTVNFNIGGNITNEGTIRIEPISGTTARLNVPTGVNVVNASSGKFYVIDGAYVQYRFTSGNDGQPYSGSNPGAPVQSGTFSNIGGYIECRNFYTEIAQDWINESGGKRIYRSGCVYTGQNFSLSGSTSIDTLIDINLSIGWHGSGNYQLSDGSQYFDRFRCQLAGTSGNFSFGSGNISGDIDYIYLRNNITSTNGGGKIEASSSVGGTTNLDNYCSSGGFDPSGKFTGSQTSTCSLSFFPGRCLPGGNLPTFESPPLPVTFGTIKAAEKGTGVQIDWTSYSESNIANYQIERSADGINFTFVGEVAPRNEVDASNYSFFDGLPLSGTNFYRIRNNDIDGKSGLSNIVKISLNKNIKTISVYPNPIRGNRVSFQTSDLAKGTYNVEVINAMGARVYQQSVNHAGGAINQSLSLPTLQSGSYTLRINGTSSSSIHKITILQL